MQRRHGVKIYAHRADAEVLEGATARPRIRPERGATAFTRICAHVENRLPAPTVRVDHALEHGETVAGLEVHSVPGHTAGSVFLRDERTSSLFSGDTLLAAHPPLTWVQGLALPYPAYAEDIAQAHASLVAFHRSGPAYENLLAGHGRPIVGGARDRALRLLDGARLDVSR